MPERTYAAAEMARFAKLYSEIYDCNHLLEIFEGDDIRRVYANSGLRAMRPYEKHFPRGLRDRMPMKPEAMRDLKSKCEKILSEKK